MNPIGLTAYLVPFAAMALMPGLGSLLVGMLIAGGVVAWAYIQLQSGSPTPYGEIGVIIGQLALAGTVSGALTRIVTLSLQAFQANWGAIVLMTLLGLVLYPLLNAVWGYMGPLLNLTS